MGVEGAAGREPFPTSGAPFPSSGPFISWYFSRINLVCSTIPSIIEWSSSATTFGDDLARSIAEAAISAADTVSPSQRPMHRPIGSRPASARRWKVAWVSASTGIVRRMEGGEVLVRIGPLCTNMHQIPIPVFQDAQRLH